MLILAVMHGSIYCSVYIIDEERLAVQICGLHKDSNEFVGKRALWICSFWFLWQKFLVVGLHCVAMLVFFFVIESSSGEIRD